MAWWLYTVLKQQQKDFSAEISFAAALAGAHPPDQVQGALLSWCLICNRATIPINSLCSIAAEARIQKFGCGIKCTWMALYSKGAALFLCISQGVLSSGLCSLEKKREDMLMNTKFVTISLI